VRGFQCSIANLSCDLAPSLRLYQHESKSIAPHPPTPSPREFGEHLIPVALSKGPNSRGEGELGFSLKPETPELFFPWSLVSDIGILRIRFVVLRICFSGRFITADGSDSHRDPQAYQDQET